MASIDCVIERWLETLQGSDRHNLSGSNVFGEGGTLYSYGRHFPLCEYLRADRRRKRPLYLMNGDRFSVSTSRHQREAQAAIGRAAGRQNADTIIVPFSALTAAGIDRASIVPLEVRPDEWITVDSRPCPVDLHDLESATERVQTTRDYYGPDGWNPVDVIEYRWHADGYRFYRQRLADSAEAGPAHCDEWPQGEPRELSADWRTLERRAHRLGDSLFLADTLETRTVRRVATVREIVDSARWGSLERDVSDDGTVPETRTVRRRARYISSFDVNEPAPLYFLATLPRSSRARTVADAIEDLAPPAVHAAILRGRHVERQGDIFAIETTLRDEDLAGFKRARLTQWTRSARAREGEVGYIAPLTAAERRAVIARARVLWRARWHETPRTPAPSTPRGTRANLRERADRARVALERARDTARRAVFAGPSIGETRYGVGPAAHGYRVARARETVQYSQRELATILAERGTLRDRYRDMSAIRRGCHALELWNQCKRDAYHEIRPAARPDRVDRARRELRDTLAIHGTAHTATEVARGPGGRVYLRGTMRHVPAIEPDGNPNRRRDHVDRKLRDGVWYLAVRNTVPRQRSTDRRPR